MNVGVVDAGVMIVVVVVCFSFDNVVDIENIPPQSKYFRNTSIAMFAERFIHLS